MENLNEINLQPQEGPQKKFLETNADIAIYGGSAGSGKSYAMLLEPLRHYNNAEFNAVLFRKTYSEIRNAGGLWDESHKIYSGLNAKSRETFLDWIFPSGMKVKFAYMGHENDKYDWQGSQIPLIGFDELTHFSMGQFFYMLSRNRSTSGVSGYVRATCNPDSSSWVRKFIDWWIDSETGYAIKERSGILRWFIRVDDSLIWADNAEELINKYGNEQLPKSVTFICSSIYDNKILLEKDPAYLSNLRALPRVEKEQLLMGNWNISRQVGDYFKKYWFKIVPTPNRLEIIHTVRYWDRASTEVIEGTPRENDPDWTVGLKMSKTRQGIYYIEDVRRERLAPLGVERLILNTAISDGPNVHIYLEQDPGQAGQSEVDNLIRLLSGFVVYSNKVNKNKVTRALPVSAQAEAGNIFVVKAGWNEELLNELESFPEGAHDDMADCLSGSFNMLNNNIVGDFSKNLVQNNTSISKINKKANPW